MGLGIVAISIKISIILIKNIYETFLMQISDDGENSKWNDFVESIKSKLTVKQVVDGVRSGGSLTFDYLVLIVTAE